MSRKLKFPLDHRVENLFQHIIPESCLKRWATPNPPSGRVGQIWLHQKLDPRNNKLQSPGGCFGKDEHYTVETDGNRDLGVERALARTEAEFGRVMVRIERGQPLRPVDKVYMSFFVASMLARVEPFTDASEDLLRDVLTQANKIEEENGCSSEPSDEITESLVGNPGKTTSAMAVGNQKTLARMHLTIHTIDDSFGFLTSDAPACLCAPAGSGAVYLGNEEVECTLPLSPLVLAIYTWSPMRVDLTNGHLVDEINRRIVQDCHKEFVSWTGEVKAEWLDSHAVA